jgi:indolepyruvate ferredoxin oxidoreductase, beta subunit
VSAHNEHINIYLCGVGGQGIGLLSEVLIRACMEAGHRVKGVDTHGLAQRGGIVVSQIKLGPKLFTPRINPGEANLVIALELLEGYRAAVNMLAQGGTVVYYDTQYQPIHVRMNKASYPTHEEFAAVIAEKGGQLHRVHDDALPDPRMQNTALLGRVASLELIPGVTAGIIERCLLDTVPAAHVDKNRAVFEKAAVAVEAAR